MYEAFGYPVIRVSYPLGADPGTQGDRPYP